jgi:hypothetical protein
MKALIFFALFLLSLSSFGQYYYKDIIGTEETRQMLQSYLKNKVASVSLTSYDENNTRNEDFFVQQEFDPASLTLRTITRSGVSDESILLTLLNPQGQVIKTIDSTGIMASTTLYTYNPDGFLAATVNSSNDTTNTTLNEEHLWQYSNGKVSKMLRVKNKVDTTVVNFKLDEKGNIAEEQSVHKGLRQEPVYYYYDNKNRLTDVVRFNNKAKRLLPEYMFEYGDGNQVVQKITVPANGSEYLIWRYQYDTNGLKVKEVVYNRYKQLTGKVEYNYVFGK